MQLGVRNDEAAALAEANGMKVVMNRCPKIEYGRLSSEIAWMGVNTRTISSKKGTIGGVQRMSLNRTTAQGGTTDAADHASARKPGAMVAVLTACRNSAITSRYGDQGCLNPGGG